MWLFFEVEVDIFFNCKLEFELFRNLVVLFEGESVERFVVECKIFDDKKVKFKKFLGLKVKLVVNFSKILVK